MHELSIAMEIVESLTGELMETPGQVDVVRLRVGAFSGVIPEALVFAWEIACDGSRFAGSQLEIADVPVVARCESCNADRTIESIQLLQCPVCNSPTPDIVAGKELEIMSVELTENGQAG